MRVDISNLKMSEILSLGYSGHIESMGQRVYLVVKGA